MSATSKRNRALLAGEEPVTDKSIYLGDEPVPEHLGLDKPPVAEPDVPEEPVKLAKKKAKKKESDDG